VEYHDTIPMLLLAVLEYCFEQLAREVPPSECDKNHDDYQSCTLTCYKLHLIIFIVRLV